MLTIFRIIRFMTLIIFLIHAMDSIRQDKNDNNNAESLTVKLNRK
jgi:hypothetical protein